MKILFAIGPLKSGGAERVVCNLSNYFVSKNNDVMIAITGDPNDIDYELDENIKVFSLDKSNNVGNKIIRTLKRVKELRKIIIDEKIDIALGFLPEPSYRLLLAKTRNLKVIVSDRNDPAVEYKGLKKIFTKVLYSKADGFVFQTNDARDWFQKSIIKRSTVIPNPLNPNFIVKDYSKNRKNIIVTTGRLEEQKNHKLLINAFSKISNKYKDYELEIYGVGSKENELKEYVKSLKLEDKIHFMGLSTDIKKDIYDSKLFILSSDFEGMPNALMEAMALGIPSISTDCPCGGPRFLIKNKENGLLTKVNDVDDLVNNIDMLLSDKKLYNNIEKNSIKIGDSLNPKVINKKWEDYIKKILKG